MDLSELKEALATVVAIPVTPFAADGSIDRVAYGANIRRTLTAGVSVMTPNGNTGEFYSLTPREMSQVLADAVAAVGEGGLVLAGVGFAADTAIEMAREARSLGVKAVMVHQPVHPFRSADGWLDYHRRIADAVPELAIVPYLRDPEISATMLSALAAACPNFVAIKYAVPNPLRFTDVVSQVGEERLTWICGLAEGWAPYFWLGGARGFTSGLVNVTPGLSLRMLHGLEQGDNDDAMAVWHLIRPFEALRARRSNALNVSVVKEAMAQLDYCSRTVRPPISELSDGERVEVQAALATMQIAQPVG